MLRISYSVKNVVCCRCNNIVLGGKGERGEGGNKYEVSKSFAPDCRYEADNNNKYVTLLRIVVFTTNKI